MISNPAAKNIPGPGQHCLLPFWLPLFSFFHGWSETTGDHVNNFIVPFLVALLAFGLLFIGLDIVIMKAQGLSLFFHQ